MNAAAPLLRLSGIVKRYPTVVALDGVGLEVAPGQIHAVLGENGAGKSTLMKIIYGAVQPDAGEMQWQGRPMALADPVAARALGIAMVFQHFALFESISVVENIALAPARPVPAAPARRAHRGSRRRATALRSIRGARCASSRWASASASRSCAVCCSRRAFSSWTSPRRCSRRRRSSSSSRHLETLAREGTSILYVSHKLEEIRRLCDRATILRGGKLIAVVDPRRETEASLAAAMIGRDFPEGAEAPGGMPASSSRPRASSAGCRSSASTCACMRARSWASPASPAMGRPSSSPPSPGKHQVLRTRFTSPASRSATSARPSGARSVLPMSRKSASVAAQCPR